MALFLSSHENKVDNKGRVSVPASFRSGLGGLAVVLFRSNAHACIEGFDVSEMKELSERLYHYDFFSAEQDDMATAIFGEAVQLQVERDGRIVIPSELIAHANNDGRAMFVGMGRKFQIWQPEAFAVRRDEARKAANDRGLIMPRDKVAGDAA